MRSETLCLTTTGWTLNSHQKGTEKRGYVLTFWPFTMIFRQQPLLDSVCAVEVLHEVSSILFLFRGHISTRDRRRGGTLIYRRKRPCKSTNSDTVISRGFYSPWGNNSGRQTHRAVAVCFTTHVMVFMGNYWRARSDAGVGRRQELQSHD